MQYVYRYFRIPEKKTKWAPLMVNKYSMELQNEIITLELSTSTTNEINCINGQLFITEKREKKNNYKE